MHARTGYQYPPRLKHFLRVILLAAAGYSRSLEEHSDDNIYRQLGMAYLHGIKFLMKPVKKSERLTQQFAEADVKFVKVCGSVVRRVQTLSVPVGKGGGHTDPGALANLSVLVNPKPLCPSLLLVPCLTSLSLLRPFLPSSPFLGFLVLLEPDRAPAGNEVWSSGWGKRRGVPEADDRRDARLAHAHQHACASWCRAPLRRRPTLKCGTSWKQ